MRFGLVVATKSEMRIFNDRFQTDVVSRSKFRDAEVSQHVIHGREVWAIQRGAGEIRAAAVTQELISTFNVEAILNFGVCGGLTEDILPGEPLLVSSVIHYDYDISGVDCCEPAKYEQYPSIYIPADLGIVYAAADTTKTRRVTCASGDKFLAKAEDKRNLRARFETAQICEMEAAGILLTANAWNKPALLIKSVADDVTGGAAGYYENLERAANSCLDVLDKFLAGFHGGIA